MNANLRPPFRGWSRAEESQKHGSGGENTPRIGLVLSSGGSRGIAHAGVIQVLEENDIPIAAVAGCSMGAYVGALWAAGLDGKALEERAREIKDRATFKKLLDFIVPPSQGLIRGEKIRQHLERDLGTKTFEELERELIIVATDLDRLMPHVFDRGRVSTAVHASAAIPAICAPVRLDGRRFTDGGASEPLPVGLLKQHCHVDHVIAVNVMPAPHDFEAGHDAAFGVRSEAPHHPLGRLLKRLWHQVNLLAEGNVLDTFRRALMAAQLRLIVKEEAAADVVIHPRFTVSNWHDFENFGRYLQAGREAAITALPAIRELLLQPNPTPSHAMKLDWNTTPREVWQRWQLTQLRDYLARRVLPFSKHYHGLFDARDIRSWADWHRVPFTSKRDLTNPRDFVLVPDAAKLRREPGMIFDALLHGKKAAQEHAEHEFRPILLTSTTGRSADPVPFLFTKHDLAHLDLTGTRLMLAGASQRDWRHINLFPYAPHLGFWQAHHAGLGFGTFMLSTGGGKTLGTEGNIKLIDKIQPDVLIGMPTFLYHVLREALETGKRWTNLKRLVLGGEKAAEGLRARLRELAAALGSPDVHVMATYGFTEAKMAFPECVGESHESFGYHLSPDLGLIELIDPKTGHIVPDGHPGEIVFTPLDSRGTVVLRYRTGDIAEGGLHWEKCPNCGRTCPRLLGPISRVSEVKELHMDKLKGTLVNFNVLEHLLDDQRGIAAWQLELRKRHDDPLETDEVHLHLAAEPGISPTDLELAVTRRFHEATEITPNEMHFHTLAEMREHLGIGRLLKEEKIADHRPKVARPLAMSS